MDLFVTLVKQAFPNSVYYSMKGYRQKSKFKTKKYASFWRLSFIEEFLDQDFFVQGYDKPEEK